MITVYPYRTLGSANNGWLSTHYHFSFAEYHDPKRMRFGHLRAINEDVIQPGTGFDLHPHRDMEIITYVIQGAITHEDSQGNRAKIKAGDVQVMTAGTGITHSEYNLESTATKLFQIWVQPRAKNLKPSWAMHHFHRQEWLGGLELLVSGKKEAFLTIHQDVSIYGGSLGSGQVLEHRLNQNAYLVVIEGSLILSKIELNQGDGAEIENTSTIGLESETGSKFLLIET